MPGFLATRDATTGVHPFKRIVRKDTKKYRVAANYDLPSIVYTTSYTKYKRSTIFIALYIPSDLHSMSRDSLRSSRQCGGGDIVLVIDCFYDFMIFLGRGKSTLRFPSELRGGVDRT